MISLLITGTDTAVGKTWVARALSHALVAAGRKVVAVKPVETGCDPSGSHLEDGALLAAATGQAEPRAALFRFTAPIAPALAAEREGQDIDLDALVLQIEAVSQGADVLLVEGAGGLLSPITWEWTVVDLARSLGAAALVVAADRLGTINHTQLTLSALELAGIPLTGVVLTAPETPDESTGTNAASVARLSGLDHVLSLPRENDPSVAAPHIIPVVEWLETAAR
ncbi:MAG TPA: dethiobiotin synthase [Gemmatimonadales bacterium]|nr:dethiobiotin synthase [Gemmatimonadales bacterium]